MEQLKTRKRLKLMPEMFSLTYWKIKDILTRFRIIKGGSSAGKSYAVMQDEIIKSLQVVQRTLVLRKYASDIKESVFEQFISILNAMGLEGEYNAIRAPFEITLSNGSKFIFKGIDDPEKIKSIVSIRRIVMEEMNQFDYEDFKEINRRARGFDDIQITGLFNPVSDTSWIKSRFFDREAANVTTLTVTYKENKNIYGNYFITQADIDELLSQKGYDENQYNIYALGEWGQLKNGSEYYPHWSMKFVEPVEFLPHLQFMVTGWDFNAVPYMTCECCQIQYVTRYMHQASKRVEKEPFVGAVAIEVLQFRFYMEYTFEHPKNSVESIAEQYRSDHDTMLGGYDATMDVYGDSHGFNRVEGLGNEKRFDWVIDSIYLAPYIHNSSLKAKNPNVAPIKRRDFINEVFAGRHPQVEIVIDPSCKELIDDFKYCKQGVKQKADGSSTVYKIKKRVKNKSTGETYEEHGHASDGCEYIISEVCRDMIKKS